MYCVVRWASQVNLVFLSKVVRLVWPALTDSVTEYLSLVRQVMLRALQSGNIRFDDWSADWQCQVRHHAVTGIYLFFLRNRGWKQGAILWKYAFVKKVVFGLYRRFLVRNRTLCFALQQYPPILPLVFRYVVVNVRSTNWNIVSL